MRAAIGSVLTLCETHIRVKPARRYSLSPDYYFLAFLMNGKLIASVVLLQERHLTLTNREIAGNNTWISAECLLECPFCSFLSRDNDLVMPVMPCPACGGYGRPRIMFPDGSSIRLLEMVSYFYGQAWDRRENRASLLALQLSKVLGRQYEPETSVQVAFQIQGIRSGSRGTHADFDGLLVAIQKSLALESTAEARKVFVPLLEHSDTNDEHQITVLLTAALLEKLFKELLIRIAVHKGGDWQKARDAANSHHLARKKRFEKLTAVCLEDAVASSGVSGFHSQWETIRNLRNKFMHGQPFVIDESSSEKAFEVTMNAVDVFAYLHNRFCIRLASTVHS